MKLFSMEPDRPDTKAIPEAVEALRRGELVIFPTETVYGLAANANSEPALRRVYEAKGRPEQRPLPVQIADASELFAVALDVPEAGRRLADKYWPGPLTLVLTAAAGVSVLVTAGTGTVGVRVPDHPVALALLRKLGSPIVATSANLSGESPPRTAQEAVDSIGNHVSVVLDAGECGIGVVSTVVDVTAAVPRVLREGAIPLAAIREVVGETR